VDGAFRRAMLAPRAHKISGCAVRFSIARRSGRSVVVSAPRPTLILDQLMRNSLRQIEEQYPQDDVEGKKLDAFYPIRFTITADLKQDVN
jgi:predicted GNAT family N-acyltransferase